MRDETRWLAEVAMHRIERRTLPAQRHEVLGALTALRLQLTMARRRTASTAEGQTSAAAGVSLADCDAMLVQHRAAQHALTDMRLWDGPSPQRHPLTAVLAQCVAWARQPAAMLGHRLEDLTQQQRAGVDALPIDASEPVALIPMVDVPRAHHLVLGLVYEAIDRLDTPTRLVLHLAHQARHVLLSLTAHARGDMPAGVAGAELPRPHSGTSAQATGMTAELLDALAMASDGAWQLVRGVPTPSGHGLALRCMPNGLSALERL